MKKKYIYKDKAEESATKELERTLEEAFVAFHLRLNPHKKKHLSWLRVLDAVFIGWTTFSFLFYFFLIVKFIDTLPFLNSLVVDIISIFGLSTMWGTTLYWYLKGQHKVWPTLSALGEI